jgi:hypothetical protein
MLRTVHFLWCIVVNSGAVLGCKYVTIHRNLVMFVILIVIIYVDIVSVKHFVVCVCGVLVVCVLRCVWSVCGVFVVRVCVWGV